MPLTALEVLPDAQAVAQRAATLLLQAMGEQPALPLGLATGRTMEPVYAALVALVEALPQSQRRPLLQRWLSFNLDEYVLDGAGDLGVGDRGPFARDMAQQLGRPLRLGPDQLLLPNGLAADPDAEARRYRAALAAAGGIGLQLLGLGLNGHIGFNEPPCAITATTRCVTLSASTRQHNAPAFGGNPEAVPARAISLGIAEILQARQLLLVVTGAAKAEMLRRSLQDPPCAAVPASWLQAHGQLRVLADAAAASQL